MIHIPDLSGVHKKPCVVMGCNKNEMGVVKCDQMLSYHLFESKLVKWWKKFFFHFFDIAIANTHIYITRHLKRTTS
jgi:hypothetical protein